MIPLARVVVPAPTLPRAGHSLQFSPSSRLSSLPLSRLYLYRARRVKLAVLAQPTRSSEASQSERERSERARARSCRGARRATDLALQGTRRVTLKVSQHLVHSESPPFLSSTRKQSSRAWGRGAERGGGRFSTTTASQDAAPSRGGCGLAGWVARGPWEDTVPAQDPQEEPECRCSPADFCPLARPPLVAFAPRPPLSSPHPSSTAQMATSELASTYAALILADEGLEITVRPPLASPHLPLVASS